MTISLKQSTAATLVLGPFVDSTDGVTAKTALSIVQADIRISKNGGAFAQSHNSAGATHMENGYYSIPLDTTDSDTLGRIIVAVSKATALPVFARAMVMPANVWDSLHGAAKLLVQTDAITDAVFTAAKFATDAIDANALKADAVNEIRNGLGLASANLDTQLSGINGKTTNLPSDPADASDIAAALATIAAFVNPAVASIKAKTDLIPASPAAVGDVPTTAAIAGAVWALAGLIDGKSPAEAMKLITSVLLGKASGLDTGTPVYRDMADTKPRVTATTDVSGNRSAVTLDAS